MNYTIHFSQVVEYIPYLIGGAWISLQVAFTFCISPCPRPASCWIRMRLCFWA
jgi:hypothetical protein